METDKADNLRSAGTSKYNENTGWGSLGVEQSCLDVAY